MAWAGPWRDLLLGKRTNMVFLLYQLALYPLLAILGIMGAGE